MNKYNEFKIKIPPKNANSLQPQFRILGEGGGGYPELYGHWSRRRRTDILVSNIGCCSTFACLPLTGMGGEVGWSSFPHCGVWSGDWSSTPHCQAAISPGQRRIFSICPKYGPIVPGKSLPGVLDCSFPAQKFSVCFRGSHPEKKKNSFLLDIV